MNAEVWTLASSPSKLVVLDTHAIACIHVRLQSALSKMTGPVVLNWNHWQSPYTLEWQWSKSILGWVGSLRCLLCTLNSCVHVALATYLLDVFPAGEDCGQEGDCESGPCVWVGHKTVFARGRSWPRTSYTSTLLGPSRTGSRSAAGTECMHILTMSHMCFGRLNFDISIYSTVLRLLVFD